MISLETQTTAGVAEKAQADLDTRLDATAAGNR